MRGGGVPPFPFLGIDANDCRPNSLGPDGSMLDVRRLRYFVAIARCGSMAAASRELNIAQPSLSHHISDIENAIGVSLFLRYSRGVTLTEAGGTLLVHARQILSAIETAEAELLTLGRKGMPARQVTLALLPSWGTSLAPAIIAATSHNLPDIALRIVELRNDEAIRALERGDVDLAVMLEPSPRNLPDPILREPLMFVSNTPGSASVRLSDLASRNLILPSAVNQLRGVVDAAALSAGLKLQPLMEIDGQDTIKSAVEAGVGGSIMSWNSVRSECIAGRLHASFVTDPQLYRDVYLGTSKGVDMAMAQLFFILLAQVASQSVPGKIVAPNAG